MNEVCEKCGLQKNLCVCVDISKEMQKIKVKRFNKMFGKVVTKISGIENKERAKELAKILKRKLACGGTVHETEIELQGNHIQKVKEILLQEGYNQDLIEA
jgi:translation initiation factor 1